MTGRRDRWRHPRRRTKCAISINVWGARGVSRTANSETARRSREDLLWNIIGLRDESVNGIITGGGNRVAVPYTGGWSYQDVTAAIEDWPTRRSARGRMLVTHPALRVTGIA